ncbi:T9SS type A sorting domain-containing protein [Halosquirtibacter laminarini]|uniref:T9SS type A sorting domain-containing protein n=1 Tax=Halosquirtibacter laminarini TaxID=3374600 RepID=A0AC61NJW8_9BACT|nr:T9SS type A sorting domain-containing protein [Prolixibacteraceae bacterium]
MKKIYCFVIVMLMTFNLVFAQNKFLPFVKKHLKSSDQSTKAILPKRDVKTLADGSIEVTYYFKGAEMIEKNVKGDPYHFLQIKGFGQLGQVGAPALPMRNDPFGLSKSDIPKVVLISSNFIEYENILIHPTLDPPIDTEGAPEPQFKKDVKVYNKDAYYPSSNVSIVMNQQMRDIRLTSVRVCPVQYNPKKKILRVYSKITYRLLKNSKSTYSSLDKSILESLQTNLLNASQLKKSIQKKSHDTENPSKDYIIITHSSFNQAAQKLAAWKANLGYTVEIISQDQWTSAQVRKAISDRYHQWNPKPNYYVIVGDVQFVPSMHFKALQGEDFVSDLYYACMDGDTDFTPDMARGRISVKSADQANAVIDKIINYEKNPVQDENFYENGLNCAQFQDNERNGYANRRFCHTSEDIRSYVRQQGYDVERIYYADSGVNPTHFNNGFFSNGEAIPNELLKANGFDWDGDAEDIIRSINQGKFYVLHRDHGYAGGTGWAHPEFVKGQMRRLHNGNKLPVVFSINCHTGEFSLDECFAEKFLRIKNGGAVAVFGASYYSMSGPNDGLAIGMFESIWPAPGILPSFGRGSSAVNPPAQGFNHSTTKLGDVLNLGLLRMNQTWAPSNSYLVYTYRLFHLFGDPAMRMWTKKPTEITATLPSKVALGYTTTEVQNINIENALVTLTIDGKLITKQRSREGNATLRFEAIKDGREAVITISKENCRPVVKKYTLQEKAPVANLRIVETMPIIGNSAIVHFTSECEGEVTNYLWSFGTEEIEFLENTTASSQNPVVRYLSRGTYTVSLKATNPYGKDTHTVQGAVQIIEGTPSSYCQNNTKYLSKDYGFGIYKVQIGDKYVSSGSSYTDEGYKNFTTKGIFEIDTKEVAVRVTVGTKYSENIAIYVDRNNDGTFSTNEQMAYKGGVVGNTILKFVVDEKFLGNQNLRMRVMSDYYRNVIKEPCQDLGYGQAEDYLIKVSSSLPTVETIEQVEVYEDHSIVGMRILATGGSNIIEQGVVVSQNEQPTIADLKYDAPKPYKLAARVEITGLKSNTKYYARAFARNSSGINYGATVTLITKKQIKKAPKYHVTRFVETTHHKNEVSLSWSSNSSNIPDGHVIKWGTSLNDIADPIDGYEDVEKTVFTLKDQTEITITELEEDTRYYFKIYPFNNRGKDIRYLVNASVPTTSVKTSKSTSYNSLSGNGIVGIEQVRFNLINNSQQRSAGYNNYRIQSTAVENGRTYPLEITVNNIYVDKFWTTAWIDWNDNGSFEASERYDMGEVSGERKTLTKNITVPQRLDASHFAMRIIYAWNRNSIVPSGSLRYFNAEDYTIKVKRSENILFHNIDNLPNNKEIKIDIYPNPATSKIHIVLKESPKSRIKADIIDVTGNAKYSIFLDKKDNIIPLNLPKGIYFIRIKENNRYSLHKLIIK